MKDKNIRSARIKKSSSSKAAILLYHQVIDVEYDPYELAVSPRIFRAQMKYLKKNYNVISLDKLVSGLKQKRVPKRSIVVTFDDGYFDNYLYARPILESLQVPATFFVSTAFINTDKAFWWDRLARVFHPKRKLPAILSLRINKIDFTCKFSTAGKRKDDFWRIYHLLKCSPPWVIERSISYLEQWAKLRGGQEVLYRTMNGEELKRLAESRLFLIGAHTHYHSSLSQQTTVLQSREIRQSKQILEKITETPIRFFSYPYGSKKNYNAQAVRILRECGFEAACSVYSATVDGRANPYELPRWCLGNWWNLTRFKLGLDWLFSL